MGRIVFAVMWLIFAARRRSARVSAHSGTAKKVRLGIQSNNIGFLPFHLAYHKGFYREQGIDLETIFMATQAVNAAFVRGDIDYSAAINGSHSRPSCAATRPRFSPAPSIAR